MRMRCSSERSSSESSGGTGTSLLRATAAFGVVALAGLGTPDSNVARAQQQGAERGGERGGSAQTRGRRPDASGGETDFHEVREGDTLWDLSERYFGNPRDWPELWSYNAHITNPHWIYPGDIVYLGPPPEPKEKQQEEQAERNIVQQPEELEEGLRLSVGGFVVREKPEFVGRIAGSPKEARLLGEFDTCWVGFGDEGYTESDRGRLRNNEIRELRDPGEVQKRDRFAIVEYHGELENDDGDVIGHKYLVLGSLVVTETDDEKLETAYIDQSWREIERGAFLVPYERQLRLVEHVPADRDLAAKIVDSLRGTFDFGQFEYVFLNKGADDGVRIGNRFYIYQRQTGLSNRWGGDVPDEVPWNRVGRVRVVDVTKNFATALITDSKREIAIGDRLEMYEGN